MNDLKITHGFCALLRVALLGGTVFGANAVAVHAQTVAAPATAPATAADT